MKMFEFRLEFPGVCSWGFNWQQPNFENHGLDQKTRHKKESESEA